MEKILCFPLHQVNVCVPVVGDFSELPVLSFKSELSKDKDTKSMGCQASLAERPFGAAAE